MKKLPILFTFCCMMNLSCLITSGQTQIESYPTDKSILQRIEQIHDLECTELITKNIHMSEPLPLTGDNIEDSTNIQFNEINIVSKSVGLDPYKLVTIFPEVIITDRSNNMYVDYLSLIPILLEAINEQQEIIKELNYKIDELAIKAQ